MKKLTNSVLALALTTVIGGCASTSNQNVQTASTYPEIPVVSTQTYVWDNTISEALNVARMAQPAGVGNGLRDFEDGTKATTGRIGTGGRAFDAALGMASMGVFGVLSMESLNQRVNKELDWHPAIVDFIESDKFGEDGKKNFDVISEIVGAKIVKALTKEHGEGIIYGSYSPREIINGNRAFLINDLGVCEKNFQYMSHDKANTKKYVEFILNGYYADAPNEKVKHCTLLVEYKIAGKIMDAGVEKQVVVAEVISGHYFNAAMIKHYDGYVLVPDVHEINAADRPVRLSIIRPYAFISKGGKELMFENKKGA